MADPRVGSNPWNYIGSLEKHKGSRQIIEHSRKV